MRQGVLWTNLSLRRLAKELAGRGFHVSVEVVVQLLDKHHLGRRKALKKRSQKRHPQRDRQFQIIAHYRALYERAGNPILSIDTKKKELIGNLFRAGHLYTQRLSKLWTTTIHHWQAASSIHTAFTTFSAITAISTSAPAMIPANSHATASLIGVNIFSRRFTRNPRPYWHFAMAAEATLPAVTFSSTAWRNWPIASAWKYASATILPTNRSITPSSTGSFLT